MASSKKIGSDKGSESSLEKVKKEAEKLQSTLEDAGSVAASASQKQTGSSSLFAVGNTSVPNPSKPMDSSVLENIGIVGSKSKITSSSVGSVTSLSDAHKSASKGSLLPDSVKPAVEEKPGSSIQVNPTYKPAFESEEKAKLAASMDRPKSSGVVGSSLGSSLQSRLEKEQGNVYRASVGGGATASQQLGGGFRMASDPNAGSGNRMSSGSSYGEPSSMGQGQIQNNNMPPQNTAQATYQTETVTEKSGKGMGAIGLIGGVLVAGGVGAVVMNPDLLSTTGISSDKLGAKVVSAPEALIPQAMPSRPAQVQKARAVVVERKVAAVQVMPAPVAPVVIPSAPVAAQTKTVQSNTRFSETGKDVPLNLDATVLKVKADQYIRIGGMPDGAELSSGVDMGDGNWLVAPDAVKGLKFTALDGYKGTIDLYMQKIKDDARTAVGTPKTFKVAIGSRPAPVVAAVPRRVQPEPKVAAYNPVPVQPQPAPAPIKVAPKLPTLPEGISEANEDDGIGVLPTAKASRYQRPRAQGRVIAPARAPRRLSQGIPVGRTFSKENYGDTAEPIRQQRTAAVGAAVAPVPQISAQRAKLLLKRGNNLYRLGDLISARSLYGQVAAGGNAEAAMAMGRTYDPIYFEKLGVQGFQPEPNRALEWYEKAKGAGLAKAQGKIDNLNYYLKQ